MYIVLLCSQREENISFLFIWAGHLSVSGSVSLFELPYLSICEISGMSRVLVGFLLIKYLDCTQEGKKAFVSQVQN